MGSGFKDFAAGDVLTAADVDGYLMRQTTMVFASTSARDTALSGNLEEGMIAYNSDDDEHWFYDGSDWRLLHRPQTIFAPTLTSTGTNPNIGSVGVAAGTYTVNRGRVQGAARFTPNGTGISAGTGTYLLGLPFDVSLISSGQSTTAGLGLVIGHGIAYEVGGSAHTFILQAGTSGNGVMVFTATGATTMPFTFNTSGDSIRYQFDYEASSSEPI